MKLTSLWVRKYQHGASKSAAYENQTYNSKTIQDIEVVDIQSEVLVSCTDDQSFKHWLDKFISVEGIILFWTSGEERLSF